MVASGEKNTHPFKNRDQARKKQTKELGLVISEDTK